MAQPNDHLADEKGKPRVVGIISTADEWTYAIDTVLSAAPTQYTSAAYDITSTTGAWVNIFIDSTGAPTNVRILAQFSHDGGLHWYCFEEGLWASLFWEDTDTAAGIYKTYLLPCGGQDLVRFQAIGTGTGAGATFAVQVWFRAFRGAYGVAHA
jgi:hypothetical protein